MGSLDTLNAGITDDTLLMRMKLGSGSSEYSIPIYRALLLHQNCNAPAAQKHGRRIINISSVVGQMGDAGQANYARQQKAGLHRFHEVDCEELGSRGVTVNDCTWIYHDRHDSRTFRRYESVIPQIPLGKLGGPKTSRTPRFI